MGRQLELLFLRLLTKEIIVRLLTGKGVVYEQVNTDTKKPGIVRNTRFQSTEK